MTNFRDQTAQLFTRVSTSSDDLLSPSSSAPVVRSSLSNDELNISSKDGRSLDYYNFCAPALPAHSSQRKASLRNKLTLSGRQLLHSDDALYIDQQSPNSPGEVSYSRDSILSRHHEKNASDSDAASPAYASIDDYKLGLNVVSNYSGNLKHRSSSCDCLDMHEAVPNHIRVESDGLMYDKLTPIRDSANSSIYDSLGPRDIKSESSSPDHCDDYIDQKMKYLKRTHKYEYIGVDILNSEKSGSNSPVENPSDWTSSLPVGLANRFSLVAGKNKETKTLHRRKQLPMQESGELNSSELGYNTVSKPRPPRLSRENSVENSSQVKNTSRSVAQARSTVTSVEMLSSTDSVPEMRRESVFSDGSSSSAELEPKVGYERVKHDHSISPIHKTTREIWMKPLLPDHPLLESPDGNSEPPNIPKRGLTESLSPDQTNESIPPLPPKPQESRFTVPLPQAQFDFDKLSPPPKPKVLYPLDSNYAAVTFANGDHSHAEPMKSNRPSVKISQVHSDVSYVAVDFEMTEGLQRTSEQVADHQREFFETQHNVN